MHPKTTTIPMIENMRHHPRELPESPAPVAAAVLAARLDCEGFISRSIDSTSPPTAATANDTCAFTKNRSPHHETSEWCSRFHKLSAVVETITGFAVGSTARNSFSAQH